MADFEHLDLFDAGRGPQFDSINIAIKHSPRRSRAMGFKVKGFRHWKASKKPSRKFDTMQRRTR